MDVLQQRISSLNKREREEFEAAKRRGYLIDRSRTRDDLGMTYMTWCDVTTTPYIGVRRGGVKFWFLSGSASLSSRGVEDVRALFRKFSFLVDDEEEYNWVCGNCGQANAILPEDRERLARELFLTIRKYGALDTSMRDICPPLPFDHSISAWVKDQAIPYGWLQLSNS